MRALLDGPAQQKSYGIAGDLNTQSVWRQFYTEALELPVGYNAFKSTNLLPAEWRKAHVLHDVDMGRSATFWFMNPFARQARALAISQVGRFAKGSTAARVAAASGLRRFRMIPARSNATEDQLESWQHPPPDDVVARVHNLSEVARGAVAAECKRAGIQSAGCDKHR